MSARRCITLIWIRHRSIWIAALNSGAWFQLRSVYKFLFILFLELMFNANGQMDSALTTTLGIIQSRGDWLHGEWITNTRYTRSGNKKIVKGYTRKVTGYLTHNLPGPIYGRRNKFRRIIRLKSGLS